MKRNLFDSEHDEFRAAFRSFIDAHAVPFADEWTEAHCVDREFWKKAGAHGFLGFEAPEEYGGLGVRDFRYNAVIAEETALSGMAGDGFSLHNDIVAPYLIDYSTPEQQDRWLPGFVDGSLVTAIAMTEPGAGSDLAAISTKGEYSGDDIIVTGSKTFITNGSQADLAIVLVRTGERDGRGMSLVAVENGTPGFSRGRPLKKAGRMAQDTAELFFDGCRVPVANIIGERGRAFDTVKRNLPRERLSIAVNAVASARRALDLALIHVTDRRTFGKRLIDHQVVMHRMAELSTLIEVSGSHIDRCIEAQNEGDLTAETAAGAKYWATEVEGRVLDACLQLFGGYGYMDEYPISRMWRDARIQRIYGGANEVMLDIVGRSIAREVVS